ATDLIAAAQTEGEDAPWQRASFSEQIAALQRDRQREADALPGPVQYFDRSPVCTLALTCYTRQPVGPVLAAELDRITADAIYQRRVLFLDLLGFVIPTEVRRIDLDEAQRFEQCHVDAYTEHGYTIERIPAADPAARAALIIGRTAGESLD
ncbi:MAG TPA: AAA family ATPase, partial [Glycomyces sp.]|nr:AAA family ATPase [Glycomyces sp.]